MPQKETNVWKMMQLVLSPLGFRLMRNQRYKGPIVRNGEVTKYFADCGVGGDGGSDLIGWRIITVTPDMVGKKFAQFVAIETKVKIRSGVVSDEQKDFINLVNADGGFACASDDPNGLKNSLLTNCLK